jgi:hypothetical protein
MARKAVKPSNSRMVSEVVGLRGECGHAADALARLLSAAVVHLAAVFRAAVGLCPPRTGAPMGLLGRHHFTSSVISGSASWMILRSFAKVAPRQSGVLAIMLSMSLAAFDILRPGNTAS